MDLDWEQEERGRRARREAEERKRSDGSGKRDIQKTNGQNLYLTLLKKEREKSAVCGLVGWLCGEGTSQSHDQDKPEEPEKLPDITESHMWKNVVDANAIIMMAVAVFMWGYFA